MEALGMLIAAGVATWVYSDARARHATYPVLWGVGTFLLLIVVLPAWLLLRPPRPDSPADAEARRRCLYCGVDNPMWARTCRNCHRDLEDQASPRP